MELPSALAMRQVRIALSMQQFWVYLIGYTHLPAHFQTCTTPYIGFVKRIAPLLAGRAGVERDADWLGTARGMAQE